MRHTPHYVQKGFISMCCDITNPEAIKPFIYDCLKRHKRRKDFRKMIFQKGFTIDEYNKLKENDPATIDKILSMLSKEMTEEIKNRSIKPFAVTAKERFDSSSGKVRLIGKEKPIQRLYDYVAVRACENLWHRRLVVQQCSSIKDRGQVYGMRLIKQYMDQDERAASYAKIHKLRYTRKCRYYVKMDIRHCFQSIDRELLLSLMKRDLEKEENGAHIIYLWSMLLDSYKRADIDGLMIGSLPSQWAAQYMVSFIYRELAKQNGVSHIVIFMDDILVTSPNRRKLLKAAKKIRTFAKDSLHLTIKPNFAIHKMESKIIQYKGKDRRLDTGVDMMGYVVHKNGKVTIRARTFIHARRMVLRYQQNGHLTYRQAKRLISYKGAFVHSNCRKAWKDYNLSKVFSYCAKVVSNYEKRKQNGRNMGTVQQ